MFASNSPAGPPSCGHEAMKPRCFVGARPFHRQEDRAAPFAADADSLDEADDRQDDGAPDADGLVGRDKSYGEGGEAGDQQGCDQGRLASDAVAVVAEDRSADRAGDEADRIDREGFEDADQRIRMREEQLAEDQAGHGAVEEKIVPLDGCADRARYGQPSDDHGQGAPLPLRTRQSGSISASCRHEACRGEGQQQARAHQPGITGRQRGEQVGKGEATHGDSQQALPLQPCRQHSQDRSADGIGEGEGSDQMARRGQTNIEVVRQGRQQSGDHEALGADRESAKGQPDEGGQRSSHGETFTAPQHLPAEPRLLFGIREGR